MNVFLIVVLAVVGLGIFAAVAFAWIHRAGRLARGIGGAGSRYNNMVTSGDGSDRHSREAPPYALTPHDATVRAGFDPARLNALADELEGEALTARWDAHRQLPAAPT